jgi:hypothetical protein
VPRYLHLTVPTAPEALRYTSPKSGGSKFKTPQRDRGEHARKLIGELQGATEGGGRQERVGNGFYEVNDLIVTFESEPNFQIAFESLDLPKSGINLLAVSNDADGRNLATVRVPHDKVGLLLRKLEAYRDNGPDRVLAEGEKRGRDNRKLVESISQIKRATLRQLWTDPAADYPAPETVTQWEVWLRGRNPAEDRSPDAVLREAAADFGYRVFSRTLEFVDRSVVLVEATAEQLARSVDVLGVIAEVRKAKTAAAYFDALGVDDQHARIQELNGRVVAAEGDAPVVALLDTGVNRAHPLLAPILPDGDLHAYNPAWGVHDSWPHGTGMAGLAIFGDLARLFERNGPVALRHRLESLKLVERAQPHPEELYGLATIEGISRLEVTPHGRRLFCMAITTDGKDRGRPSSWSAALDNLAAGVINDTRRLILVCAGNAPDGDYPAVNLTSSVQDPAQSWNALTVGGMTDLTVIDERLNPGYMPVAERGDIAPAATTSLVWPKSPKWPFKPDIVMEAGNKGRAANSDPMYLPELTLLTTSDEFLDGHAPLMVFHDTSAATALASRLAASLWSRYPDFTPETVRALMVHAARWTPAMIRRCTAPNGLLDINQLLRTFGYGVPDEAALFSSATNALTLIAQSRLQPFVKEGSDIKTNDLNMHALPWPTAVLQGLPLDTNVQLRVTLSYFVEPSPGERGWDKKYGYASHGLRFAVQRPTESVQEFKDRINKHAREETYAAIHQNDAGRWTLGTDTPPNGSIHSNIWTGTAAQLANRSHIAVYPTQGWWKTRPKENRYERTVDYSLVVALETPDEATDIYTPVAQQIGVPVEVLV